MKKPCMDWCHPAVNVINQASTKTTFSCKPVWLRCLLIRTLASTTCGLYNFIHKIFAKFMSFCRVLFLFLLLNFFVFLYFYYSPFINAVVIIFFIFLYFMHFLNHEAVDWTMLQCFRLNDVISNQPTWYTTHKK